MSNKKSLREKSMSKSSPCLPKPKSAASVSSVKSTKTSHYSLKSVGSQKSNVSSLKSKSSSMQFTLSKAGISKRKMVFLNSYKISKKSMLKSGKKSLGKKSPGTKSLGKKSLGKKSSGKKSPGSKSKLNSSFAKTNKESVSVTRGHDTFDQNEFLDFMKVNDLSYLIRSASVCKMGFQIKFTCQCLTVFSCSNFYSRGNEGAVALIDSTAYSIRFIRYKTSLAGATPLNNQQLQPQK